jgi:hypothetical protein
LQRYTRESDGEPIPTPFNFVFGHTHNYDVKTCEIDGKTYTLINTGGWLKEDQKTGKNAGILVIDESRDGQYDWQAFE